MKINGIELPEYAVTLTITHNEHKVYYETAEQFINGGCGRPPLDDDDILPEHRARCIATNEIWEMMWYPNTPVGSHSLYAPTLEELLKRAEGL